ncbi:MAG: DUF4386 domain-containing protein, partial [Chloroflexi bacterium]|nr:DUF4386 domain-containing protein [Chloroflexota bacterium]
VLFLVAMVSSIFGGGLIESVLETPEHISDAYENSTLLVIGALLELLTAAAVVGIAVMMFSILARYSENMARAYVCYRVLEAAIVAIAVITPLALITLSQDLTAAGSSDSSSLQTLGAALVELRGRMAGLLVPVFFSLSAVILYWSLYQSRFVPRFISVWGLIGVALLIVYNLLETFGVVITGAIVLALPIILNEVFLAIWLIARGFRLRPDADPEEAIDGTVRDPIS